MKSPTKYKAALYQGESFDSDFWYGNAVDRQLVGILADYWIKSFLDSDFYTTSAAGTMRTAVSLRNAARKADRIETQQEIVGICLLARNINGLSLSINQIMDRYNLSADARSIIINQLPYHGLADDVFVFDHEVFLKDAPYSSVELDIGSILVAPSDRFEDCFSKDTIDEQNLIYRYTTEGKIVDQRIRGRK